MGEILSGQRERGREVGSSTEGERLLDISSGLDQARMLKSSLRKITCKKSDSCNRPAMPARVCHRRNGRTFECLPKNFLVVNFFLK